MLPDMKGQRLCEIPYLSGAQGRSHIGCLRREVKTTKGLLSFVQDFVFIPVYSLYWNGSWLAEAALLQPFTELWLYLCAEETCSYDSCGFSLEKKNCV